MPLDQEHKEFLEKIVVELTDLKPKDVQPVIVQEKSTTYASCFVKRESSSLIRFPQIPQMVFENPVHETVNIESISVIPDDNFKTNGTMEIVSDGLTVLVVETAGDFTDVSEFIFKPTKRLILENTKEIKVYMASSGGEVNATVSVLFSD